jgi:ferredoxin--NADP+ reductase
MEIDTLIFAIGDKVDGALDLPVAGNEYHTATSPLYPVEGITYEVGDAVTGEPIRGLFVAGWSRVASSGLVGAMKKDGIHAAIAIENFLEKSPSLTGIGTQELRKNLARLDCVLVEPAHLGLLDAEEKRQAKIRAVDEFKFSTNEEMLSVMGLR